MGDKPFFNRIVYLQRDLNDLVLFDHIKQKLENLHNFYGHAMKWIYDKGQPIYIPLKSCPPNYYF